MTVTRPLFVEGRQWRKLTASERDGKPWKYVLLQDVTFWFDGPIVRRRRYLYDETKTLRGIVDPMFIAVCCGYAWNGCSYSPDWLLLNSLPHDLLYQFSRLLETTRRFADELFLSLGPMWLSWMYYAGLCVGSWTCWNRPAPGCTVESEML